MKVAMVIPGFQSSADDWCIPAFTNLARHLSQRVDLHVFALRYPHRRDSYRVGDTQVHAIGGGAIGSARVFGVSLVKLWADFASELRAEHRKAPFDLVLGIWATESGWLATCLARELHLPSVVHLAGGELFNLPTIGYGNWGRPVEGRMVRETLWNADLLTVPSGPLRRRLARLHVNMSKVISWSLGVDTDLFSPGDQCPPEPFTFVTVGSLIPVKGHKLLLRALSNLRAKAPDLPVRLRIVGSGKLKSQLAEMASTRRPEGCVTFDGEVAYEDLPTLYRSAHAFLLGSLHEAQCMAALEALACGLPWIAPPVGALADLASVGEGEAPTGFTYAFRQPDLLADLMLRMATMPLEQRTMMSEQARRRALRDFDARKQTSRLIEILEGLTGGQAVGYDDAYLSSYQ